MLFDRIEEESNMAKSLYGQDVNQQQLTDFQQKTKIRCLTHKGFRADDKAVEWKCRRNHKWHSSYIDAQIHGCPKCATTGAKKLDLSVLGKNAQEVTGILVTLRRIEAWLEQNGFPNASFGPDSHYHFFAIELFFIGVHFETWVSIVEALDKSRSMMKWRKNSKRKCCGMTVATDLNTVEKVEAISRAVAKTIGKIGLSKAGKKSLLTRLRGWRKKCEFCVDVRNTIAHGTSHLPFKNGGLNSKLFTFLRGMNAAGVSSYYDEIRKFMDLSDIVLKIGDSNLKGGSKKAKKNRASYTFVARHQIQSLFGVV
jgi:hypothetical protein